MNLKPGIGGDPGSKKLCSAFVNMIWGEYQAKNGPWPEILLPPTFAKVHRSGEYATPTLPGRSHAAYIIFAPERFFGRSKNRNGKNGKFTTHTSRCGLNRMPPRRGSAESAYLSRSAAEQIPRVLF